MALMFFYIYIYNTILILQVTPKTFNPCTASSKEENWINAKVLKEMYGPAGGACCTIA